MTIFTHHFLHFSDVNFSWKRLRPTRVRHRVEIPLSFLISSCVLEGPGLEYPDIDKTGRGTVCTRLVFLGLKKNWWGPCQAPVRNFLFRLSMENLCISVGAPTRESLLVKFVVYVRSIRYNISSILYSH